MRSLGCSVAQLSEQLLPTLEVPSSNPVSGKFYNETIMVMGGDSRSEGSGFKSKCRILDGDFFTLICCKIVLMFV